LPLSGANVGSILSQPGERRYRKTVAIPPAPKLSLGLLSTETE
jgi:hypothetical protein